MNENARAALEAASRVYQGKSESSFYVTDMADRFLAWLEKHDEPEDK